MVGRRRDRCRRRERCVLVSNHVRKDASHGHAHGQSSGAHGHHLHHNHNHHHRRHARKQRRRRQLRTLVFAATALLAPHHGRPGKPKVTTTASYTARPSATLTTNEELTVRPDPKVYEPLIQEAAAAHKVDPALIRAVMRAESAFHPLAVSRVGAVGLMQLMPELASQLGVKDIFDPRENIMAGARYLRELLDRHHGKVALALASYNAGPGAVDKYHGIQPFKETRNYVKTITGFLRKTKTGDKP